MSERLTFPNDADLARAAGLSPAVARYARLCAGVSPSTARDQMRLHRHREWMTVAVPALLGGVSVKDVCQQWSNAADAFLTEAFHSCFSSRAALFALGKLGSEELNLSSDVDIVVVSSEEIPSGSLQVFQKLLSENSPCGFVLRTDFDLRPGGRMGPIIPTVDQFVDYYGNYGETWERMAFVRLRPITGDAEVVDAVMSFAAKFSYRRHLDYGLLEDLKTLRSRIHVEHWKRSIGGRIDLKLGIGGIRDVELFLHALQIIHGGKDPGLRVRSTDEAARRLAEKKLLPREDAEFLRGHYWNLRELENHLQALNDEQTHLLDPSATWPDFIASRISPLKDQMDHCSRLVSGLLGNPPPAPSKEQLRATPKDDVLRARMEEILEIPMFSRNKDRDEATRRGFLQRFLAILEEQNADASMALDQLKEFLRATRAKGSFFDLLVREEKLLRELAWLFGHSRYLGRLLCYRPELLDAFVFRSQDLGSADFETLLEQLVEKRLLAEIIEGGRFLRDLNLVEANAALTSTADGIVTTLADAITREHPSDIRILALGKWGAEETGFRSDLDFIFVAPKETTEADHRFARRMISRLTEPHRGGSIYPIDLRLRPSGKAGPIVMPAGDLAEYLENEAQAWERQAYFRARWVGAPLFNLREKVFARPLTAEDLQELDRIRRELLPKTADLDLKLSEGGLVDIELYAQTAALLRGDLSAPTHTLSLLPTVGGEALVPVYERLRQIEQIGQLVGSQSASQIRRNAEELPLIAASLKFSDGSALLDHIAALFEEGRQLLGRLDPRRHSG